MTTNAPCPFPLLALTLGCHQLAPLLSERVLQLVLFAIITRALATTLTALVGLLALKTWTISTRMRRRAGRATKVVLFCALVAAVCFAVATWWPTGVAGLGLTLSALGLVYAWWLARTAAAASDEG